MIQGNTTNTVVELKKASRIFGQAKNPFYALRDIELKIAHGEFTGLVGPSGSGKTTLLNLMGALDFPTEGEVEILGISTGSLSQKDAAHLRATGIGFIFQQYQLFPVYSVLENVEFPLLLLGLSEQERRSKAMQALEWVGLCERADSRPSELSGGQCQRVAIARAVVKEPKIVLADEPTANLDSENSHNILKTMLKINEHLGTTFVFSTHDERVIQYLKRKVTLVDGRIMVDESF